MSFKILNNTTLCTLLDSGNKILIVNWTLYIFNEMESVMFMFAWQISTWNLIFSTGNVLKILKFLEFSLGGIEMIVKRFISCTRLKFI